jgi:low temperature requirement protein LtrA
LRRRDGVGSVLRAETETTAREGEPGSTMTTPAGVMEEREVSPLELFYDLVFVFAVSQLSEHLVDDLTWRGAAETLVLLCAVFTVWLLTTFEATYFDITRRQTQIAVLTAMVLGLFMNAAIGVAFSAGGWAFVVPLVVTQVARGIITSTTAPTPQLRQHYRRALTWLLASAPFWIAGGGR